MLDGIRRKTVWNLSQDGMESVARQYGICRKTVWNPSQDGMESTQGVGWNQAAENTPTVMPYAFGDAIHAKA